MKLKLWLLAIVLFLLPAVSSFAQTDTSTSAVPLTVWSQHVSTAPITAPVAAPSVVAPSGATEAIPQPNGTTVFIYPLIHDLEPYIAAALGVLITFLVGLLTAFLKQHFNVVLNANQQAQLTSMVKTEAGSWIAKGDASVMNAQVNVGSPDIAAAANKIIASAPDIAKALGVTPTIVQQKIVGEIGHMQASSSPSTSPPSK